MYWARSRIEAEAANPSLIQSETREGKVCCSLFGSQLRGNLNCLNTQRSAGYMCSTLCCFPAVMISISLASTKVVLVK